MTVRIALENGRYITGQCVEMCPASEVNMRTKEKLLHRLEKGEGLKPVKEFRRSAAGMLQETPKTVRPPSVLQDTVTYLFNSVILIDSSLDAYDFVENRLRAVRQDLFTQQCPAHIILPILQPIARFYSWASYWYSECSGFDPVLNDKQLLETLKICLRISDDECFYNSPDIEALYLLLNLGDPQALTTSLSLPKNRRSALQIEAERLSISWYVRNYVKVFKQIHNLPILLAAILLAKHQQTLRRYALNVMSVAFNSKNLKTPISALIGANIFENVLEASSECSHYGIIVQNHLDVLFLKSNFNHEAKTVKFKRPEWLQKQFSTILLPTLFLTDFLEPRQQ